MFSDYFPGVFLVRSQTVPMKHTLIIHSLYTRATKQIQTILKGKAGQKKVQERHKTFIIPAGM